MLMALDTAGGACGAALWRDGAPVHVSVDPMTRGHAEAIFPLIDRLLVEAGVQRRDLDRIAVTCGPGSFTGVRVGLAAARGLGVGLGIPVIGLDTLSVLAAALPADAPALAAIDARRGEVYLRLTDAAGAVTVPPQALAIAEAVAAVPPGTAAVGSGVAVLRAAGADLPPAAAIDVDPVDLARLAAALPAPAGPPSALYLRAPDAVPPKPPAWLAVDGD